MRRQLDINLYLALNGYPLRKIPEERIKDYMSEPHYSTDAISMLELDIEMRKRGYELCELDYRTEFLNRPLWKAAYRKPDHLAYDIFRAEAETEILARAMSAFYALTGEEWVWEVKP